jgi:phosphocarrier protein HPr
MTEKGNGLSRNVLIRNEFGLHARPAAGIARIAQQAIAAVWIFKGDEKVDAASVIDLLTLSSGKGTTLTITVEDPRDLPILCDIVAQFEAGFGES